MNIASLARARPQSPFLRGLIPLSSLSGRRNISIHRIAGSLGAEIHDVDISPNSLAENPGIVKEIREALLEHQVIFFRDTNLSPKEYLAFTSNFGKPVEYPFVRGIEGYPEIIQVLKQENETINFGGIWHSDTSYFVSVREYARCLIVSDQQRLR